MSHVNRLRENPEAMPSVTESVAAPAPHTRRRSRHPGPSEDAPERLLDVHAAADVLSVAPRTLYKWAAKGRLPVVHLGRAVRFRESTLRELVRVNEEPAAAPLARALD